MYYFFNLVVLTITTLTTTTTATPTVVELAVNPQLTDPNIDNLGYHIVMVDSVKAVEERNKRPKNVRGLIWLPGSMGQPNGQREVMRTAAELGYLVMGLSYVNDQTVAGICMGQRGGTGNASCEYQVRYEIITGEPTTPLVDVSFANSILNRALKLALFTANHRPAQEGWASLLDAKNTSLQWDQITVAGHSQGGGNAVLMAQIRKVFKAVAFSSPADQSDWAGTLPSLTPSDRYFGVSADRDPDCNSILLNWNRFGMPGPFVLVTGGGGPGTSHQLCSRAYLNCTDAHGSTAVDRVLQRTASGVPLLRGMWQYMLAINSSTPPLPVGEVCPCIPCSREGFVRA